MDINYKEFYDKKHSNGGYAPCVNGELHEEHKNLKTFLESYDLQKKRCLEIGCARGSLSRHGWKLHRNRYHSFTKTFIHSPNKFVLAAENLPFKDGAFDATWSVHCLEHVPDLMAAFMELRRVVKPGGDIYSFVQPAMCRDGWPAGFQ